MTQTLHAVGLHCLVDTHYSFTKLINQETTSTGSYHTSYAYIVYTKTPIVSMHKSNHIIIMLYKSDIHIRDIQNHALIEES